MRILFLDIDGVLNTTRSNYAQWSKHALDREAIGLVNLLVNHKGADVFVVVCSTWRINNTKAFVFDHLCKFGFQGVLHKDWATPVLGLDDAKGFEIADWLENHFEIERYAIIDDLAKLSIKQEACAVRTRYEDGLLWSDFKKAFQILHGQEYNHY